MLDLRMIRAQPDLVRTGMARRGISGGDALVEHLLALDERRRSAIGESDQLKARRNAASRRIGELRRAGESADERIAEMRQVGGRIEALDEVAADAEKHIREALMEMPNLPLAEVPDGGEEANALIRTWGKRRSFDFDPLPHWELGERLGLLDLARGAKISGSGFPVLTGCGARLQRKLIGFMLDLHVEEHGYTEVRVPYMVTRESLTATGHLPKFAEDAYVTSRDDLWLIPTSEVPLTNLRRGELLAADELPLRYTAYSPCFRREAGAAGADTRGLLRVHQFDKVELVRYETPERSRVALEEMTAEAEVILQRLGLEYRVLSLATGDLGFWSAMTYDLEVWAPGVRRWLEVSSVSTTTDYQARRANLRFRPGPGKKPEFLHTLNGSALALPRLMVALLETYQEKDGSVNLPEPLAERLGVGRLHP
jgi:seryl-tRNA synthetase